jgi:hypothetical protein
MTFHGWRLSARVVSGFSGVGAGALRQEHQTGHDDRGQDSRRIKSAEGKTTLVERFIEEVAQRGTERARQNERGPEQQRSRNIGPEIRRSDHGKPGREYQRAALITEPVGIRHPVAKRSPQRLRKQDRHPIERLDYGRSHGVD